MHTRQKTGAPLPKALACGMLEDGGRILFLLKPDRSGIERIEMPCVLVFSGANPVAELTNEFSRQTGIDAQIHEIIFETRHNAGSRKRKAWVQCLVFRVTAKNRTARPSGEFSGFRWLSLYDAKKHKLGRNSEWIRSHRRKQHEEKKE
ncbi:MAG: hypothetical protein QXD77_03250 [Candidatus Aenigmatarchaeota archaeon]